MEAKAQSQKLSTKPNNERSCKAQKGQSIHGEVDGKHGTIRVNARGLGLMA